MPEKKTAKAEEKKGKLETAKKSAVRSKKATTSGSKKAVVAKTGSARAFLKDAPVSPQKARLVANLVRGKRVAEALSVLTFTTKKSAPLIAKVITSAAANAENKGLTPKESLKVSRILVDEGIKYRRYRSVSRGRIYGRLKRRSHILVEVSSDK